MAWVDYQRVTDGVSVTGKFGESLTVTERWQIRVDSPATSKMEILNGVSGQAGVTWGSPHFEFPALQAMEFELAPTGRDGMRWMLTVKYYVPPPSKKPKLNGIPNDVWEMSGGTTSVPAFEDKNGTMIVNAAGDPLEGLEREREESSWTLTKYYEEEAALIGDVAACAGHVNGDNWATGASMTWKCYFKGAKRVSTTKLDGNEDAGLLEYIESHWEFRYEPLTWKLMPWDVGFMEINGSGEKVAILTDDGKVVKQPVGLAEDGSALPAGTPPVVINGGDGAEVYFTADFGGTFGDPALMPPAGA